MIDLGRKNETTAGVPEQSAKNKINYPYMHIDKDIGIDEKDVGKTVKAMVIMKVNSVEKRKNAGDKEPRYSCSFDIMSMEIMDKKSKEPSADWSTDELMEHSAKMNK